MKEFTAAMRHIEVSVGEYFLTLDNDRELKLSRKYKSNLDRLMN